MNSQFPRFTYQTNRATIHIFLNNIVFMNDEYCRVHLSNGSALELERPVYNRLKNAMYIDL